jgi:hypothetical protein
MKSHPLMLACLILWSIPAMGAEPFRLGRCEVVPLASHQVSLRIHGSEKVRWHFGHEHPRPFFFPFQGPSGTSLTRIGHPGAPDHDHHLSVWFAHDDVEGLSFWNDRSPARIRQKTWQCYQDADEEAVMAVQLGWYDGDGRELLDQELLAALVPLPNDEHALELQITLRPGQGSGQIVLGKTNFGLLAVRVAKSVSAYFGGGTLTDSEGRVGEARTFGQRARWMDYSGPVAVGDGTDRRTEVEGITYFDHPDNPRYPSHWHVREDGWMGASHCMQQEQWITAEKPLTLRYLLHAHRGPYDDARAESVHRSFTRRGPLVLKRSLKPHLHYEVERGG